MPDPVSEFKERQRSVWATGSWDEVSEIIAGVGPKLLDRVGIEPGMEVLDVGTGSGGSVAIPAAQRGARVVGSDLTPELFDDARRRAAEAGVDVEWVQGDAEALPFEDARFDRVLSTFAHMFAPRHARAAAELVRVCRPGGVVGTATWRPEGFAGALAKPVGDYLPPPPEFVQDSMEWGREEYVREMFAPHHVELEFDRDAVVIEYPSPEALIEFYATKCGPFIMSRAAIGDRWPELRRDLIAVIESWNTATDGSVRVAQDYLVTVARKRP